MQVFKKVQPLEYQKRFVSQGIRPDGRLMDQQRPIVLVNGNSTLVKLGGTTVVCGITAQIAKPLAAFPKNGYFVPNIDLPALASPLFKPGPPGELSQALSQQLVELFSSVPILDLEQLCIFPEKAVWVLYADIVCINYQGGIWDAAILALFSALKNCNLTSSSMSPLY